MHTHAMKRRRLRTDAVVPGGGSGTTNSNRPNYSQLVVVGYTDQGIPLYDNKCLSNDNIRPYSDSCTDTTAEANSDENDRDVGEGGNNNGSSAGAGAAHYTYECTSDRYCNTHSPGNNLDLGWTFIGICQYNIDCPDAYNATNTNSSTYYNTGDVVSVSSDYLNNNIIGSISCPIVEHQRNSNTTMLDNSMSMLSQNNSTSIIVTYLYEVETSQVVTADIFLPRLEEQILLNLADSLMSCLGNDSANDVNSKYDIQGIDSSPDDVAVNEGHCSITSAEADNCFIINGSITLLLASTPTVSNRQRKLVTDSVILAATNAAQSYIQTSMEENDLLSPTIPEVIKVKYLHDSYNEYFLGEPASSTLPQSGSNGSEDDGSRGYLDIILGSVFGALLLLLLMVLCIRRHQCRAKSKAKNGLNLMDDASDVHDTGGCGSLLMSSLGIIGGAVCGILLCKSCSNETKKNIRNDGKNNNNNNNNGDEHDSPGATEADDGLDDIIDQIDCVTDVNDRRIYVVDPPGAFHLGAHHYTGDGVRYFSPLCEACISARANADGVVTVNAANMADDDSDDDNMSSIDRANNGLNNGLSFDLDAATKFTDFNSNDLGRYHSSMHVRTCKSTTCPICIEERGVIFVKARGVSAASVGFR